MCVAVLHCELPLNVLRRNVLNSSDMKGAERERESEKIVKIQVSLHRWDELEC